MNETLVSEELVDTEKSLKESSDKVKDIKKFFDLANDNVKSATEIFNKCVEMKKKLEIDSKKLENLRLEHQEKTQQELDKIKRVKEDIFTKLKTKKTEIDDELIAIKEDKLALNNERIRFEEEKKKEYQKLKELKEKQQEELLIKSKELDEQRKQIVNDRKKLEEDRIKANEKADELAVNLSRFNELVKQFTSGIEL